MSPNVPEPPVDRDVTHLDATFARLLIALLDSLSAAGQPFRMIEGKRTLERQRYLWGKGRPGVSIYGQPGLKVTACDGVLHPSAHQAGRAADLWPVDPSGKLFCPPGDAAPWQLLAEKAESLGLVAGLRFPKVDADHVELREAKP